MDENFEKCFQFISFCFGRNTNMWVEILRKQMSPGEKKTKTTQPPFESGWAYLCRGDEAVRVHGCPDSAMEAKAERTPRCPLPAHAVPRARAGSALGALRSALGEAGINQPSWWQGRTSHPRVCKWPAGAGSADGSLVVNLIVFLTN